MIARVAIPCAVLALLAGCAGVQSALDPAGDQAASTELLWRLMLWVCGFMYVLVLAFVAAAIWKARHHLAEPPLGQGQASAKVSAKASARADARERRLLRGLTGWVALTVAGLMVLTIGSFVIDRRLAKAEDGASLHIKVTANQWWWKVEYEDRVANRRFVTANELHLPVDRAARIELEAGDVIHSFWVPNLGGKQDLIPGRTNHLTLTPRRVGVFRGQCAEFCGLQHANMALDVTVESPAAFAAWAEHQRQPARAPSDPNLAHGRDVFIGAACASCHTIGGQPAMGQVGPDLTHLASRRGLAARARPYSRGALAGWIADPQSLKPGNHMPYVATNPGELNALVDYLDSLK